MVREVSTPEMPINRLKCPKCGEGITASVDLENDIEFGMTLTVQVSCLKCKDYRIHGFDGVEDTFIELVNKLGS